MTEETTDKIDMRELVNRAVELAGGKVKQLAEATGYSAITIRRWRKGVLVPGKKSAAKLVAFVTSRGDVEADAIASEVRGSLGEARATRGTCCVCAGSPTAEKVVLTLDGWEHKACWRGNLEARGFVEVPARTTVPGVGMVYAPAKVSPEEAAAAEPYTATVGIQARDGADGSVTLKLGGASKTVPVSDGSVTVTNLGPTGPVMITLPGPTALEQLKAWADPGRQPGWLCRAAARARGLSSLATWLGSVRRAGLVVTDQDLALERAQGLLADLDAPVAVRRLWAELARLLAKRGAVSRGKHKAKSDPEKRFFAGKEEARAGEACKACGGSGLNSKGGPCLPCNRRARSSRRAGAQADWRARRDLQSDPIVKEAAGVLDAELVRGRSRRR